MSKVIKVSLLVHAIVALVLGALLLIIPGRFLEGLGWAPIDPIISRMLGAAFLALSWGSFRGWRGFEVMGSGLLFEIQFGFESLAAIGVLRHLLSGGRWPAMVWILFGGLVLFAALWLVALIRARPSR